MASAAERAARVWAFRAHAEIDAAKRFDRLAERLSTLGGHAEVLALANEAAQDERRHCELCLGLVRSLDGAAPSLDVTEPRRVGPPELSPRERLLYEIVAMSCITETISTAVLGLMRTKISPGVFRDAVSEILEDEVRHSRLGWAHLAAEKTRGYERFLSDYLPRMLEATITAELFRAADAEAAFENELAGYGALGPSARRQAFVDTLQQVVFPGLRRFDVDTSAGERWLHEQRHGRQTS